MERVKRKFLLRLGKGIRRQDSAEVRRNPLTQASSSRELRGHSNRRLNRYREKTKTDKTICTSVVLAWDLINVIVPETLNKETQDKSVFVLIHN